LPCTFMPFGQTSYPCILTGFEKKYTRCRCSCFDGKGAGI